MWRAADASQGRTRRPGGSSLRLTLTGVFVGLLILVPGLNAATTAPASRSDGILGETSQARPPQRRRCSRRTSRRTRRLQRPRPTRPRSVRLRRPRLRRGEERRDQGLRQPVGHDADDRSPTSTRTSTTSGIAGCSGWRSIRRIPGHPTSTCSTRTTRTSAAPRRRTGRPACTPTRARRRRHRRRDVVVSGRLSRLQRQRHDGLRDGAHQRLVPAVSRATRSASLAFGADGMLYVTGGDGASFNFVDYGRDLRRPTSCTRPAQLRAARSGARTCGRPSGDPTTLDGAILRLDPDTERRRPATR